MVLQWWQSRRAFKAARLWEQGYLHEAGLLWDSVVRWSIPETAIQAGLHAASCHLSLGDLDKSEQSLRRFHKRFDRLTEPEGWQDWLSYAYANQAEIYRFRRQFPEALREASRAVELHPTPANRYVHAIALKHNQRVAEAIEILIQLAELDPAAYRIPLAGYLYVAGQHGLAEEVQDQITKGEISAQHSNVAWLAACRGDKPECCSYVRKSFRFENEFYLVMFYDQEVEFDRFRQDLDFVSLVRTRGKRWS